MSELWDNFEDALCVRTLVWKDHVIISCFKVRFILSRHQNMIEGWQFFQDQDYIITTNYLEQCSYLALQTLRGNS